MKLDENMMKKVLKEEYDKRIKYFLTEKITVKDKRGINVLQYADGLKVLDSAGNQYSFGGIVKKGNEEFAKLYLPDEPRKDAYGASGGSTLHEDERGEIGFYSRSNGNMRDVSAVDDVEIPEERPSSPKLPDRKFILVPMGEFEQRFKLKTEEE
jgi:hypothetical protein